MKEKRHCRPWQYAGRVSYESGKMDLLTVSSQSAVDLAPSRCLGDHGFDPVEDSDFLSLSHARDMLNISSQTSLFLFLQIVATNDCRIHVIQLNGGLVHLLRIWLILILGIMGPLASWY